ncbi:cell division protein FtsQ/DivIB [Tautonia plasticadhaerens]|uniref:Cell division protein FtsQ n=1 Tax=Tautonia plasticadhaerens TaxID=2527974 RepID=A0A518H8C3_9BACT|nr:hypothetical protein [Tautonia plasticadhaerens]QDV37074.1 Cell division protein FtsQ [Tautonia plasticadhaerens]
MLRLAIESDEQPELEPGARPGWWGLLRALLGPRGTLAAVTAASVLALSVLVVLGVPTRLSAWVHARPEYAWSVDEVVLDPPPPPWLPGGRDALLDAVSGTLSDSVDGSSIGFPLDALERAFRRARWVDGVVSVRRSYPDRITVSLRYQGWPVALAHLPGPGGMADHFIDESGSILAETSGAALRDLGPLIRLQGIEPPPTTFPGSPWALPDAPSDPNPVALAASRLAGFLLREVSSQGMPTTRDGRPVQILKIQPLNRDDAVSTFLAESGGTDPDEDQVRQTQLRWLYVLVAMPDGKDFWVCWRSPPGAEDPEREPDSAEKMAMLRQWLSRRDTYEPFLPGALYFKPQGPEWRGRLD